MSHAPRRFALLALVAAAALTTLPAGAEDAPELVTFGISPAGAERPDGRPFLDYTVAPGSVIHDHVAVLNQSDTALDLDVYAGDAVMADGRLTVAARSEALTGAGSWVIVDADRVEVPAQSPESGVGHVIVPVTLTVPADAEPGDHVAGIMASLVASSSGGGSAPGITLDQRVATRVYIRVDGPLHPGLEIVDLTARYLPANVLAAGPGEVEISYTLRNTGNVRMGVESTARAAGPFGLLPRAAEAEPVPELLPGGEAHRTVTVTDVWPLVRESVTVTATGVPASTGIDPEVGTVEAGAAVWAVPWLVLVLLVALALAVIARRRRARRRPADTGRLSGVHAAR